MKRYVSFLAVLLLALLPLRLSWAVPIQTLESIEYISHDGSAAIKIDFADTVQYLSHFPLESSARLQIFLGPKRMADPEVDHLPFTQVLAAPREAGVPLTQVIFTINEIGEGSLEVEFSSVVRFSVSAAGENNSLLVILPDIKFDESKPLMTVADKKIEDSKPKTLLAEAKTALKKGDNVKAIRLLTKLLSTTEGADRQETLELLGVARERKGQVAHAKMMYMEYLEQYPDSEGASRVKQRLNDLLSNQLVPRSPLKKLDESKRGDQSTLRGSFSQYYYWDKSTIEGVGSSVDQSFLASQLSVDWHIRSQDYDVRNYVYASHSHDFVGDAGKSVTLETAYSRLKNSRLGLFGQLGRQTSSGGGVLGKFDGVRGSYDISSRVSINAVYGYPVNISDKRNIQTNMPFWGVGFSLDGNGKNIDILPYYIRQEVDGIVDREAIGSEFRFSNNQGSFYSLIDVDISYSDLNIYFFRGQYNWQKDTTLNFSLNYLNNPLLFTSNALLGRTDVSSIEELRDILSEEEIRSLAEERVGNSTTLSVGISHTINSKYQINGDITVSQQHYVIDGNTPGSLSLSNETQTYLSSQLIASQWFNERDTTILGLVLSQTESYDELSFSISNRLPLQNRWRFNTRLRTDLRQNSNGEELSRIRPSVKWDYLQGKSMFYEAELGVEMWRYGGDSNNPNYQQVFANLGYRWSF